MIYSPGDQTTYTVPWWQEASHRYKGKQPAYTRWRKDINIKHASWRAADLGHALGEWTPDEPDDRGKVGFEWIARCRKCGLYAGVIPPDPDDEPTGFYGSALYVKCEGPKTRPWWTKEQE